MRGMPDHETVEAIAELFKAFGDPTRVRILSHLLGQERCVSDIAEAVELTQSAVSHQLRILKQMHLIKYRREGKSAGVKRLLFFSTYKIHDVSLETAMDLFL